MVIADHALFDLAELVIGVEIDVCFDILERGVKRYGFACNCDSVGEALFAVERFGLVKVVRTVDEVVYAHEQVVGVVWLFKKARCILVKLSLENFAVAFGNGCV